METLARDAELSASTIYRIETGRVTPGSETVRRIARALSVTMDELVHVEDATDAPEATPEVPENAESAPPLSAVPGRS